MLSNKAATVWRKSKVRKVKVGVCNEKNNEPQKRKQKRCEFSVDRSVYIHTTVERINIMALIELSAFLYYKLSYQRSKDYHYLTASRRSRENHGHPSR